MIAMLAVAAAVSTGVADVDRLAWLAGTWIQEKAGVTVRETWLAPLDGVMSGASQTNRPGRPARVEFMTIRAEAAGATFTAHIPGQPPTPFVLIPGSVDQVTFENPAHDFPQRVIYRRCGHDLCARIEGRVNGNLRSQDWRYTRMK